MENDLFITQKKTWKMFARVHLKEKREKEKINKRKRKEKEKCIKNKRKIYIYEYEMAGRGSSFFQPLRQRGKKIN